MKKIQTPILRTVLTTATLPSHVLPRLLFLAFSLLLPFAATAQNRAPARHFVCNTGYSPQECATDMDTLRKALAKYPVKALGDWTWVLVRSEDWKRILLERGLNPNNPAFSYLPERETFFDGALVLGTSTRGVELSGQWHMSIGDLLDLAIRHELAHALCSERDELKTAHAAAALKDGKPLSCQSVLVANNRNAEGKAR